VKFERGVEILLVNWGRSLGSSEAGGFHKVRVREWGGGGNSRCQFHQHFMSSFCAKILLPKNTNPNFKHIKVVQRVLV